MCFLSNAAATFSGCSQIHLIECILWACYSENVVLIQSSLVSCRIQNSCFIYAWSSQNWKEARQTSVCLEVPVNGGKIWSLMKTEHEILHLSFQRNNVVLLSSKSPLFLTSLLQIPLRRIFHATLQGIWRDPKHPAQPQGNKCWSK